MTTKNRKGVTKTAYNTIQRLDSYGLKFGFDPHNKVTWCKLPDGRMLDVTGKAFADFVIAYISETANRNVTDTVLRTVRAILIEKSQQNNIRLHHRRCVDGDFMYIDALNDESDLFCIEKGTGRFTTVPDRFYWLRSPLMGALPPPTYAPQFDITDAVGSVFPVDDDFLRRLILATFIHWQPSGPRAHLIHCGGPGLLKTTVQLFQQSLFDPHPKPDGPGQLELNLPSDDRTMRAFLRGRNSAWWSNASTIDRDVADILCVGYGGGVVSDRKFYDNTSTEQFYIDCCLSISCVHLPDSNISDFYSRSLLFDHNSLTLSMYRSDAEVATQIEQLRPELLGSIYRTVSLAWAKFEVDTTECQNRLAASYRWCRAVADVLGYPGFLGRILSDRNQR